MASITTNTYLTKQVSILRNPTTTQEAFRKSMKKIGKYLGFKVAEDLFVKITKIPNLLVDFSYHKLVTENIVVIAIVRSGLPLLNGVLKAFPEADVGFISIKRYVQDKFSLISYREVPELSGKIVIMVDCVIKNADGILEAFKIIKPLNPKRIIMLGAFCSKESAQRISEYDKEIAMCFIPMNPLLNEMGYLLVGTGDGNRAFGAAYEVPVSVLPPSME